LTGGEIITRVLVWASVAGYAAGAGALALGRGRRAWDVWARGAWTAGCAAMLAHAAAAFHFYHGWSHAAAYGDTARQTGEVVGLAWGGGLYFNYALLAGWVTDVVCWWRGGPAAYRSRPRALAVAWQAFLFFMFFNAAVVFAAGAARWAGLAACAGLCAAWLAGAAAKGRRPAAAGN